MSDRRFHIGWFHGNGYSPNGWNAAWAGSLSRDWADPRYHTEIVQIMERARIDCLIMEDIYFVPDDYGGSRDYYLKNAVRAPKNDPVPLMAILGQATRHIGLLPTMSASFYPPFLAARLIATMDHLNGGRAGVNLVTSSNDRAAQNFGLEQHISHHERYEMATEFVQVLDQLWSSWEEDAIVGDRDRGVFTEPERVHAIDFEGRFFRSRGPLNVPRPPQGRPVISQAGNSTQGKDFAARCADLMLGPAANLAEMAALQVEMRDRVVAAGRPAGALKVLFIVDVKITETESAANEIRARAADMNDAKIIAILGNMASNLGIDFSKFDLDEPIGDMETNGQQGTLTRLFKDKESLSLREIFTKMDRDYIVGTPQQVARRLGEMQEELRGDGFLFHSDYSAFRKHIFDVTEGLIPELQRLGLVRREYESTKFRENLFAF